MWATLNLLRLSHMEDIEAEVSGRQSEALSSQRGNLGPRSLHETVKENQCPDVLVSSPKLFPKHPLPQTLWQQQGKVSPTHPQVNHSLVSLVMHLNRWT